MNKQHVLKTTHFRLSTIIVLSLFLTYCIVFSVLSIKKYQAFNCDLDMGNMLQAFYSTLDGRFMEMTWNGNDTVGCMWMGHAELVFILIFPLFVLFPSAYTLLILQSITIGAGGLAIYLIGLKAFKDRKSAVLAMVCYLAFPLLAAINLFDFHADLFIILPHLIAWYFYRTKQFSKFWIAIGFGILVKEHAFLFNGLLGMMLLLDDRRKGSILIGVAISQFFILTPLIQYFAGSGRYVLNLEAHVVGAPACEPVTVALKYGELFLKNLFSYRAYFVLLIAAVLNYSLFKFRRGLVILVPLCMIFVAAGSVVAHRHSILIAPVFIMLIEGAARIRGDKQFRYLLLGNFIPILILLFLFPFSRIGIHVRELLNPQYRNIFHYRYTRHDVFADSLVKLIPEGVPAAADAPFRSKLVNRQWAYINPYPSDISKSEYYLFDFFEKLDYDNYSPVRLRLAELLLSEHFSFRTNLDGIVVMARDTAGYKEGRCTFQKKSELPDSDTGTGYHILACNVVRKNDRYIMKSVISKSAGAQPGDALISFFIEPASNDTLRVLHLASHVFTNLDSLENGIYEEETIFDLPQGVSIENRRHLICLYDKEGYLPFFSRPKYRTACLLDTMQ